MTLIASRLRLAGALKLLVGLTLFVAVLLWQDNARQLRIVFGNIDVFYIGLLFAIGILGRMARVVRWQTILRDQGIEVGFLRLFNLNLIGNFIGNFVPSMLGGDIAKSYFLGRQIDSQARSAASVIIDRVAGVAAMIVLALVFTAVNRDLAADPLIGTMIALMAAGGVTGVILLVYAHSLRLHALLAWLPGGRKIIGPLGRVYDELLSYRGRYRLFGRVLFHSILFYAFAAYGLYYACLAISLPVAFLDVALITPIAFLLMSIPVSPNNVGWWEWTLTLLLQGTGVEAGNGLMVALILRAVSVAISLLGGLLLMMEGLERKSRRRR
ncbi:MAG: UPF0104 family protein [Alphaproteobacteria bacterium]|nr:MAG: UPF0104 family protein [Alphaproteobacteria bacterium]